MCVSTEPIQLIDYCLTHIRMDYRMPSSVEGIDFHKRELTLHFDASIYVNDDNEAEQHRLILRVTGDEKVADKEVGIHFTAEINGIFMLPKTMIMEHKKEMLYYNGVGVLYSTLRGLIGNFSGSFPGGRVCLPMIMPKEMIEAAIKSKHKQPSDTPDL